jgi:hypothetical protein
VGVVKLEALGCGRVQARASPLPGVPLDHGSNGLPDAGAQPDHGLHRADAALNRHAHHHLRLLHTAPAKPLPPVNKPRKLPNWFPLARRPYRTVPYLPGAGTGEGGGGGGAAELRGEDVEASVRTLERRRRRGRRAIEPEPEPEPGPVRRHVVDPRVAEPEQRLGRGARERPPLPLPPRPRPRPRRARRRHRARRRRAAPALAAAAGRRRRRRRPPHPDGGEPRPTLPLLRHQGAHAVFACVCVRATVRGSTCRDFWECVPCTGGGGGPGGVVGRSVQIKKKRFAWTLTLRRCPLWLTQQRGRGSFVQELEACGMVAVQGHAYARFFRCGCQ